MHELLLVAASTAGRVHGTLYDPLTLALLLLVAVAAIGSHWMGPAIISAGFSAAVIATNANFWSHHWPNHAVSVFVPRIIIAYAAYALFRTAFRITQAYRDRGDAASAQARAASGQARTP